MATKYFTKEEMDRLRKSKYILKVTPAKVHFSVEFKREFWEASQKGKSANDIFSEMGIDPSILGKNRINGLLNLISNAVKSGKGLRDISTTEKDIYTTSEGKIRYLEQQLSYKNQEIEFLKKIASLGKADAKL